MSDKYMTQEQMKQVLRQISNYGFHQVISGNNQFHIALQILQHLGAADPELRDKLGYTILDRWIRVDKLFDPPQLKEILFRATSDEMLFRKIGEVNTLSVLFRSFSTLVIVLVLERDHQERFLTEQQFRWVADRVVRYAKTEIDLRGYIPEFGWSHAAAHVSDALDECAKHHFTTQKDCRQIWEGLYSLIIRADAVYEYEEDERIAQPIKSMITNGKVSIAEVCDWFLGEQPESVSYLRDIVTSINQKHVLRSLFFHLKRTGISRDSEEQLLKLEAAFSTH